MKRTLIDYGGGTCESGLAVLRDQRSSTNLPLLLVLQFWSGDQSKAMRLALLLAELEAERRNDVALVFARRFDVVGPESNDELRDTARACARKFSIAHLRSARQAMGHPDGCFGLWLGAMEQIVEEYQRGWPYANAFFFEPDGIPLVRDWIDRLRLAHEQTLLDGKFITGAITGRARTDYLHVNGSAVWNLPYFINHQSLKHCQPGKPWDIHHAQVMLAGVGSSREIRNIYAGSNISAELFTALAQGHCWIANVKGSSGYVCARDILLGETK